MAEMAMKLFQGAYANMARSVGLLVVSYPSDEQVNDLDEAINRLARELYDVSNFVNIRGALNTLDLATGVLARRLADPLAQNHLRTIRHGIQEVKNFVADTERRGQSKYA